MLTFLFCNTIPGGVQIVKYFFSRISTSRNNNTQKLVEFGFLAFLPDFFFIFCPQILWHSEDIPIKCPKQCLCYIEFICRRACAKKIKSEFHVSSWLPGLQNLNVFLENLLWSYFGNHFQAEIGP